MTSLTYELELCVPASEVVHGCGLTAKTKDINQVIIGVAKGVHWVRRKK